MSLDSFASIIVAAISAAGAIIAAVLSHGSKRAAKRADKGAQKAAQNAAPVSNGFAGEVRAGLAEILDVATEARAAATGAQQVGEEAKALVVEHLQAHADAHVYQLPTARDAQARRVERR